MNLKDLGNLIKTLRKNKKMTQDELAKLSGYNNRSAIARIEKGDIDLPESKIIAIAKALEVTPYYLMGWENKETIKNNPYYVDTSKLTPEEILEYEKVTGINKQLFFNNVDEEHDMALFKQAVVDLLIKQREKK